MPFYGAAILCGDDPGVRSIVPMISRPVITYGLGADAQVRAVNLEARGGQMRFTCQRRNGALRSASRAFLQMALWHIWIASQAWRPYDEDE